MQNSIAGIDVHKRVLMVVVSRDGDEPLVRGRFGATSHELLIRPQNSVKQHMRLSGL